MQTYEIELGIIGSLLLDNKIVGRVCERLKPERLTSATLGRIYLEYLRAYDVN